MIRIALAVLLTLPVVSQSAEIIGHRGASFDAPENTVASFKLAWEQKADGAELDTYLTKDGKIIVIHDNNTKRTTGNDLKVVEHSLADLRKLDAGRWKDPKYVGEKLPTLEEMLATAPPGKKVYVEVKCGPEIVPELNRVLTAAKLKPELTPVISFNAEVIAAMKKARPDVPGYWIVSIKPKKDGKAAKAQDLIAKAKQIKADGLDLSADDVLDKGFASKVKGAGLRLDVWTVDKPDVAKRMIELGVDGITTNRPLWLREQLGK